MSAEDRVLQLEKSFSVLVELARPQSERMDEYERRSEELAEAQKQTEAHISVLAQVMAELGRAQARTDGTMADLRRAQTRTEESMAELGRAQARTEGALTSFAERFEQYISRKS